MPQTTATSTIIAPSQQREIDFDTTATEEGVRLNWVNPPKVRMVQIRRRVAGGEWVTLDANLRTASGFASSYLDNGISNAGELEEGTEYEYEVTVTY